MSGIGLPAWQWPKSTSREERSMIQDEVQNLEEEGSKLHRVCKSRHLEEGWNLPKRTISWSELWRLESFSKSLLAPDNLQQWGVREDPLWRLCGGKGTMAHILPGCKTTLLQGRYGWCHDKELALLAWSKRRGRSKTIAEHHHHPQPSKVEPPASHPEMGNGG